MQIKASNIVEQKISVVLINKQIDKAKSSNGLWISKIRKYGTGLGMICEIEIDNQIKNFLLNIYPIEKYAEKVILKTHFNNIVKNRILAYIDAWHMYNFINQLKPKRWRDGLDFKIDLWIRI